MFKIPVSSHYREHPSFEDERLHFDGVIRLTCPECNKETIRDGTDWVYCPEKLKRMPVQCAHCDKDDYIFEIKDIRDGCVFIENVVPEWKVVFEERVVSYREIAND